jgi:hypothetical protein
MKVECRSDQIAGPRGISRDWKRRGWSASPRKAGMHGWPPLRSRFNRTVARSDIRAIASPVCQVRDLSTITDHCDGGPEMPHIQSTEKVKHV